MGIRNVLIVAKGNFQRLYDALFERNDTKTYSNLSPFGSNYISPPGYEIVRKSEKIKPDPDKIGEISMKKALRGYPVRGIKQVNPGEVEIYPDGNDKNAEKVLEGLRQLYGDKLQFEIKETETPIEVQKENVVEVRVEEPMNVSNIDIKDRPYSDPTEVDKSRVGT
jgi:hypothetical protein